MVDRAHGDRSRDAAEQSAGSSPATPTMIVDIYRHLVTGRIALYEEGYSPNTHLSAGDISATGESYWEHIGKTKLDEFWESYAEGRQRSGGTRTSIAETSEDITRAFR